MYFEIPDNEKLFIDKSRTDRIVITGLKCNLSIDQIVENRKVIVVKANEVFIDGDLIFPGGTVDISARTIHSNNGKIDVSGEKGDPDFENRASALPGPNPGDNGTNGKNGGDGKVGGTISITAESLKGKLSLYANGGNGGTAQNGGNGVKGKRGTDMKGCAKPTNGHQGGNAGNAGKPGNGGKGGNISFSFVNAPETGQLTLSAKGGKAGKAGTHGTRGEGGDPGKGGVVYGFDWMGCDSRTI
ncbi:hypothetical protein [Ulvibacterium sp.]|uniref:hypothetical protein n=1 Tax=Ulvibacterium sp. TaxID=2665914 RepID=UPI002625E369|nr:hypothetical protein [Ulvibacterium sp.]